MNAMQARELMRVSRRALALIDPSWCIHRELASALDAAVLGTEDAAPVVRKAVKRRGTKSGVWAGAAAGSAWDVGRGILWRLFQERACKACGHDSTEHTPTRICSTCRCDQWTRDDTVWGRNGKVICSHCEHGEDAHRKVDSCAGKGKETDVACPCRKYHATMSMQPNICIEAAKLDAIKEKLKYCACGHWADAHAKDELENLLKCGATGCACDHFHYAHSAQEAA